MMLEMLARRTALIPLDDRYLHVMAGRIRIKIPIRRNAGLAATIENDLSFMTGVTSVQANQVTANVLIRFDSAKVSAPEVLAAVGYLSGHEVAFGDEGPVQSRRFARQSVR